MKKVISVFIAMILALISFPIPVNTYAEEEYIEYVVPFFSNQTDQVQVKGISNSDLLKNGVIMIPIETACNIANAKVVVKNDKGIVINRYTVSWSCEFNGVNPKFCVNEK